MATKARKQEITVILDPSVKSIHLPWHLAPFEVTHVGYHNRRALSLVFWAYDCFFEPGGTVVVQITALYMPACFTEGVMEIRKFDTSEIECNHQLCPVCHHLSMTMDRAEDVLGSHQERHVFSCKRIGCHGKSTY